MKHKINFQYAKCNNIPQKILVHKHVNISLLINFKYMPSEQRRVKYLVL